MTPLVAALVAVTGVTTVVKNGTGRSRGLEGLAEETLVLAGQIDAPDPGADERRDLSGRCHRRPEDRVVL